MAATSSAPNARRVVSVLSATTAMTVATVRRVTASAARTPSAALKVATTSLQLMRPHRHPHQPKKATTSPVKTVAKVDVVDVAADAALSVARVLTRTVSRWTTHKLHWVLLRPAKRARMRPNPVPIATQQAKAVKSAPATVMVVSVAHARTVVTALTVTAMSPVTVKVQRPSKTLHPHLWRQRQQPGILQHPCLPRHWLPT